MNSPDESDLTDAGPSLPDRIFFLASAQGTIEGRETDLSAALLSLAVLNVSAMGDCDPTFLRFFSASCICSNSFIVVHSFRRASSQTCSSATVLSGGAIGFRCSGLVVSNFVGWPSREEPAATVPPPVTSSVAFEAVLKGTSVLLMADADLVRDRVRIGGILDVLRALPRLMGVDSLPAFFASLDIGTILPSRDSGSDTFDLFPCCFFLGGVNRSMTWFFLAVTDDFRAFEEFLDDGFGPLETVLPRLRGM